MQASAAFVSMLIFMAAIATTALTSEEGGVREGKRFGGFGYGGNNGIHNPYGGSGGNFGGNGGDFGGYGGDFGGYGGNFGGYGGNFGGNGGYSGFGGGWRHGPFGG